MSRVFARVGAGVVALVMAVSLLQATEFAEVEPASADPVGPTSVALVTNRAEFTAGQKARLTATTDVSVTGTGAAIEVVEVATNTLLKSCVTGM